jgi:flagellar biosynthesis protein
MSTTRKRAAALRYRPRTDSAPRVVAKGTGAVAERIISIAREHDIPLREDPQLIEVLSSLDLYEEIPSELYKAVAEVLVYVYSLSKKALPS